MAGYNFRREANIVLSKDVKQRKILSISGKYTAGGVNSATTNFQTHGIPWCLSIAEQFFGVDYAELMNESQSIEHEDKVLTFSRVFQEKSKISIQYNNYSIPNSYSTFNYSHNYNTATFTTSFAIAKGLKESMESHLRQKNKDLYVIFDGNTLYNFSHNSNTGFLANPSLNIVSNTNDKDDKIFYNFSVTVELPADATGYGYRRNGSFNIDWDTARRKIANFNVQYTAGGGNSALQNYLNGARTWASTILNTLGGIYELVNEHANSEMENKLLTGNLSYQELLTNDVTGSRDYSAIQSASSDYQVSLGQEVGVTQTFPGGEQLPSVTINIGYSCNINKEVIADDTGLDDVYKIQVRPWLIAQVQNVLGLGDIPHAGSVFIVNSESYRINPNNYSVSGTINVFAPKTFNSILKLSEILVLDLEGGVGYEKIWDGVDFTFNIWGIGQQATLRRTRTIVQLGSMPSEPEMLGSDYIMLSRTKSIEKTLIGSGSTAVTGINSSVVFKVTFVDSFLYCPGGQIGKPPSNAIIG
jgi:hypothetical protein